MRFAVSNRMSMLQVIKQMLLAFLLLALTTTTAIAGETRNVNFAAFQKVDASFEFDPIVLGKFSDFISVMDGAQILILSHTADSINGDVINIQQDVLRQGVNGLGDVGINCQLSYLDESTPENTSFEVGGFCKILDVGDGHDKKLMAVIPMTGLPDTAQGVEAWVMLHEDSESGIAFYANVSKH